jgi:curved DNA-binding protein CbpA
MADFYEVLGVPRDASEDEIRQARRRLARKLHPDVNAEADADAIAAVNQAYDVLVDPSRRAAYDETGDAGDGPDPEKLAAEVLKAAFKAALDKRAPDLVAYARNELTMSIVESVSKKTATEQAIRNLQRRRAKVHATGASNLFHDVIDEQIDELEQMLHALPAALAAAERALQLIAEYRDDGETPPPMLGLFGMRL